MNFVSHHILDLVIVTDGNSDIFTGGSNEVDSSLILTNKFRLPHKVKHSLHKSKSYHLSHDQVCKRSSKSHAVSSCTLNV